MKRQIVHGLDEQNLVTLKFHKDEVSKLVKWKHSREFEYHDFMYDIIFTTTSADSITYICFPDNDESAVNAHILQVASNNYSHDPLKTRIETILKYNQINFNFFVERSVSNVILPDSAVKYFTPNSSYNFTIPKPLVPPPQFT